MTLGLVFLADELELVITVIKVCYVQVTVARERTFVIVLCASCHGTRERSIRTSIWRCAGQRIAVRMESMY